MLHKRYSIGYLLWSILYGRRKSMVDRSAYMVFRLAWIGMLSGVVIEKIQEANKVSAAYSVYKTDDSIEDDDLKKIDVEKSVLEKDENCF